MATANTSAPAVVAAPQQLPTNYASFNSCVVEGRVFHAEIVARDGQEFLAVQVIQNMQDDDGGVIFSFTNNNGLMGLFKKGYLPTGRRVHVVGHMKAIESSYTDKQTGEIRLLQRPRVRMDQAQVTLGAMPSKKDA